MAIFKAVKGNSEKLDAKEFHDGYAYLTTDDEKLYFDALTETEQKRILINPDQEQSDWNQNDPAQKDYIKNRICYREGDEIVYIPDAEYPINSYRGVSLSGSFVIPEEGTVCKVIFGDLEVEKTATLSGSTIVVGDNYNEFIITFRSEQEIYVETQRSADSVRVSVKKSCVYHKIDPEYLPDAFKDGKGIVKPKDLVGQKSSEDGTGEVFNDYKFNSASGMYAHAEGTNTNASGLFSHTEGAGSVASGNAAHAEGEYTTAASLAQHAQGKFNVEDADGKYAHIVGNGIGKSNRSNAHTIDWAGNAWFSGDVLVGGTGQDDPNTSKLMKDVVGSETQFIGFDKNGVAVAKDLTHYDDVTIVTFDGNTEGLEKIQGMSYYKVSNLTPSRDEIIGAEFEEYYNGETETVIIDEEMIDEEPGVFLSAGYATVVIYNPIGPFEGASPGMYFAAQNYVNEVIFVKSLKYGIIKTLDDKFLPPSVQERFDKKQDIITTTLILQDVENGYEYSISMKNGNLVSSMCLECIEVTSMPEEMSFMNGSKFDPTGVVISAINQAGESKQVTENVTYIPEYVSGDSPVITVRYTENGIDYYTDIPITVTDFDAETVLIDFEYIKNDDGTYTLTAWKETLNGEPSTECVVPDNSLLIIEG